MTKFNLSSKHFCIFNALYYPHTGGVERYVHQLSQKITELGNKVTIVTFNTENAPSFEINENLRIYRLPTIKFLGGRYPLPRYNRKYYQMIKEILELDIDFIITNMRFYLSSLIAAKIARRKNIPSILIEHTTGHFTVNNPILDWIGHHYEHFISNIVKKKIDYFYGVSKACSYWLAHFGIKSDGEIYNGVDCSYQVSNYFNIRQKYQLPEDSLILFFAGRLIIEKGILFLTEAVNELNKEFKNLFLFIAGVGPLYEEIKIKYKNSANILLLNQIDYDSVMNFLSQTDMVVIPSYYPEGLPTLILEAGANCCPVVTTPMGGAKEIVADENYGLTIEPKNVEEIKRAIIYLIKNPDLRKKIGKNLHSKICSNYDWKIITENLLNELSGLNK